MTDNTSNPRHSIAPATTAEQTSSTGSGNDEMDLAWELVSNTGVSVFLTGNAGTGKTTFMRKLRDVSPKRMVVLAPTGVAAINAGGQTIHSFFQLPFGPYIPGSSPDPKKSFRMSQAKKDLISTLDLLIIDEISMVRADLLDQVDDALRRLRHSTLPFGGVQLLLIGDLMQLSPVANDDDWRLLREHYPTPYFFSSKALSQTDYVTVELKHIYRQRDERFISLLGAVRAGRMTPQVVAALNSRYMPDFKPPGDGWIRLTTHNRSAQAFNQRRLDQLSSEPMTLEADIEGDFPEISYPTDEILTLKEGAQVMFVKNDPSAEHAYYNGKIGIVNRFTIKGVEVACGNELIEVTPVTWANAKYSLHPETKEIKEEVVGTFKQYPLRLAWAITVHKSQGLTFDHAVLDINASFAHGQVYVALSRCRTLEGLVLSSPIHPASVITDPTVNRYIESASRAMAASAAHLPRLKYEYTIQLLDDLYAFDRIESDYHWLARVIDEYLSRQLPGLLAELKDYDSIYAAKVTGVAARFRDVYRTMLASAGGELERTPLAGRVADSATYFERQLTDTLTPLIVKASKVRIGNKKVAKIYKNALTALRQDLDTKLLILHALRDTPFSTSTYLNLKAKARLKAQRT